LAMGIPQDGTTPGCSRSQIEWGVCKGWIGVFTSSRGSLLPSKPTPKALHENCFAGFFRGSSSTSTSWKPCYHMASSSFIFNRVRMLSEWKPTCFIFRNQRKVNDLPKTAQKNSSLPYNIVMQSILLLCY